MATDTSEYLFEEGELEKDDDKTPFTVVSYRKTRTAGISVIFKTSDAGSSFGEFIQTASLKRLQLQRNKKCNLSESRKMAASL